MRSASARLPFLASTLAALALAGPLAAGAEEAGSSIYQQRNADGSITLTDRPSTGAVTQRTWRVDAPDPSAAGRRESARQDAAEVSRRIGQRLEADDRRAHEQTIARIQAAALQAQAEAEAAAAESQMVWVAGARPRFVGRPGWNTGLPVPPSTSPFNARPPTVTTVRGIPLRADGFPNR